MSDTILDGGITPAPISRGGSTQPDGGTAPQHVAPAYPVAPTMMESPAGGPAAWGHTIIEDVVEDATVFAALRVVKGNGTGRIFDLRVNGDTRMGRDVALNDVVVADSKVSAQQLIIRSNGDSFGVIDLGSANGTFVNEEKVLAPVELNPDDRLRIGDVVMVFHLAKSEPDEASSTD